MCQSHYRQDCKYGRVWELKSHRPRRKDTVRLGGLSLEREAAETVKRVAAERRVPQSRLITDVLEGWAKRKLRGNKRRRGTPGTKR
jgi:hypothetical protein